MAPSGDDSVTKSHCSEGPCAHLPQPSCSQTNFGTTETPRWTPPRNMPGVAHFGVEREGLRPGEWVWKHSPFTKDASMGTGAPPPVVLPVHVAPKKAPCPRCGKLGPRKRTFTRRVR